MLVGYVGGVRVAVYGHWRKGPHQDPVAQLERPADLMIGCLRVSKLLIFPTVQTSQSETATLNTIPVPSCLRRMSRLCAWRRPNHLCHAWALATAFITSFLAPYRSALKPSTNEQRSPLSLRSGTMALNPSSLGFP